MSDVRSEPADGSATTHPSFREAAKTWIRIGLLSFGGPAGQIALMHKVIVDQKRWIDEGTFLVALNFCTLLPGPEAMQLATYTGWRLHGTKGGLTAGLSFVAPGAIVILAIAALYWSFGSVPLVVAVFAGIKAAVLAIVVEALLRIARRALTNGLDWFIAVVSFLAIFFIKVPFPAIVLIAGLAGSLRMRGVPAGETGRVGARTPVPLTSTLRTAVLWLAVWILPLVAVALFFGSDHVLTQLAVFFSKLAVVTFGGAYAVLAYMAQDVVEKYGWLKPGEMLDGLGLAETTPGPLILVTEFVGYLAAARHSGGPALSLGALGAAVALWATFAPCFLWVFAGAPYVEWLKSVPRLKSALAAITAAVVGVIFNLSLWFALHVFFRSRYEVTAGPLHFDVPLISSLESSSVALAVLAVALLFFFRTGIAATLAISALASLVLAFVLSG